MNISLQKTRRYYNGYATLVTRICLFRANLYGTDTHWPFVREVNMEKPRKIISGSFSYVARQSRIWAAYGYRIVKQKQYPDGKWTLVLEKFDD